MSLLKSLTKKSRLDAAIKTVAQARKSEGGKADQLFLKAYQEFQDVIADDLVLSETLYNWGFGLLQEGKTKPKDIAIKLFEDAINKFSFCQIIQPNFLGAAIDGGVTFMELARLKAVQVSDPLYQSAKKQFEIAESIQKGSAIYNLACIYALIGDEEHCFSALKSAVEFGSLPNQNEVLNDPDLEKVKSKAWFIEFIDALKPALKEEPKPETKPEVVDAEPASAEAESDQAKDTEPTENAALASTDSSDEAIAQNRADEDSHSEASPNPSH